MLRNLYSLFCILFKIGFFSVGGGYVMLPLLRRELVERRDWITDEELVNYYAIGQSTPGIIAINTATFIGFKRAGIIGSCVATFAMVLPSLIIIIIIAAFFSRFQGNPIVSSALCGVRIVVSLILVFTVFSLIRKTVKDWLSIVITSIAFIVIVVFRVSPILVVLSSAVVGLLAGHLRNKTP